MTTRRDWLAAVGGGLTTVAAGCLGGAESEPSGSSDREGTDGTNEDSVEREAGADDSGETSDGSDARDDVAEPYRLADGEYATIVVFRNDDPHPGYEPEALEAVEDVFIAEGVPLTHGVIPAPNEEPITREMPFCQRLRERARSFPGLFEFSVHGYTHAHETDAYGGSEFAGMDPDRQRDRIAAAKQLLIDCFDTVPTTFIPPFNTYDDATLDALVAADIEVISAGGWFTRERYGDRPIAFSADGVLHLPNTQAFIADWSTLRFHDIDTLRSAFEASRESGEPYVQMLHYQYFTTDERIDLLRSLIRHMMSYDDTGFLTLEEFGRAVSDGRLERIEDGWRYRGPVLQSE